MKHLKRFLNDTSGIFYTAFVIVITLFIADIIYLVVALGVNQFFDNFEVGNNVFLLNLQSTLRNVGPFVIVILNIGLLVLLAVAAWKRGTVEAPLEEIL